MSMHHKLYYSSGEIHVQTKLCDWGNRSKRGLKMHAQSVLIIFMLLCFSIFYSCSDESVVSTPQSKINGTQPHRLVEEDIDIPSRDDIIYCIAINKTGDIIWLKTYDSIDELGFPLSERQMGMWEMYDLAVVDVNDLGADADLAVTIDETITNADMIILASGDIPANWSCIKQCSGSDDYELCIITCMGKRPKRSGW